MTPQNTSSKLLAGALPLLLMVPCPLLCIVLAWLTTAPETDPALGAPTLAGLMAYGEGPLTVFQRAVAHGGGFLGTPEAHTSTSAA